MASAPKTLKALRQAAPRQDRNDTALVPTAQPQWTSARDGSRFVAISLYPGSLEELRTMSRSFGEAAVADVRWGAIITWMMKAEPSLDCLRNPYPVVQTAIVLMQEHDRHYLGWPHHDGAAWPVPVLDGLKPDCQREARLVAAETLEDWEAAGSPWLDASRIKSAYHFLTSCPAFRTKYIGPDHAAINTQEQE